MIMEQKQDEKTLDLSVLCIALLLDIATVISIVCSIFARSYHHTTTVFVTGSAIHFDVGLIDVNVYGNPTGFLGRYCPSIVSNTLLTFINVLNKRTLAEFEAIACFTNALVLKLQPNGCSTAIVLRLVSGILFSSFICSTILLLFGFISLILFGTIRRTLLLCRVTLFLHILPSILLTVGISIYLLIGGFNVNFVPEVPYLAGDVSLIDLGSGFFFAVGSTILSIVSPLILYFGLTSESCEDNPAQWKYDEPTEEIEELLGNLRTARNEYLV